MTQAKASAPSSPPPPRKGAPAAAASAWLCWHRAQRLRCMAPADTCQRAACAAPARRPGAQPVHPHAPFTHGPRFYKGCCKPYHSGANVAPTLEATIRARFCAVPKKEVAYLVQTCHPGAHPLPPPLQIAPPAHLHTPHMHARPPPTHPAPPRRPTQSSTPSTTAPSPAAPPPSWWRTWSAPWGSGTTPTCESCRRASGLCAGT